MDYVARLGVPRHVYIDGRRVDDVRREPALAGAFRCIQEYYRQQTDDAACHLHTDEQGRSYATSLLVPRTKEDLERKRRSYEAVAELSFGMIGRSPDFMNAALCSIAAHANLLGTGRHADYAANARAYFERCRGENLFIGHATINPQLDRSKSLGSLGKACDGVRLVAMNADGITVEGAKMIATLAPLVDELVFFNMPGLTASESPYALAFTLPVATTGLHVFCRKSFFRPDRSHEDQPLSNRFDEIDAYIVLERVFVPWRDVFVCEDVERSNVFFGDTLARSHSGHQGIVRGLVKAKLMTGTAIRIARAIGLDARPEVQQALGELTTSLELVRAAVLLAENDARLSPQGVMTPSIQAIDACRYHFPNWYERMARSLRSLAPGSMLANLPYAALTGSPPIDLQTALGTSRIDADERVRLLSLAWDLCGSDFAMRHIAYEYTHAGDPGRIASAHYRSYATEQFEQIVGRAIGRDAFPQLARNFMAEVQQKF